MKTVQPDMTFRNWQRVALMLLALVGVAAFIIVESDPASARRRISRDDFEHHDDGPTGYGWHDTWDFDGNAGFWDFNDPYSGDSHMRLRGDDASATRVVEISGESSVHIQFWARAGALGNNDAIFEVSSNGSNWVEMQRWDRFDGSEYTFWDFDLSTSGISFDDSVWVRIRINGPWNNSGDFYMDDFEVVNVEEEPDEAPQDGLSQIEVDGEFSDWDGQAMISDPANDASGSDRYDIAAVYWANNIDEGVNYHMIERHTTNGQSFNGNNGQHFWARYILFIDTNNNGSYSDNGDRKAIITYMPTWDSGLTNVKLYPVNSGGKIYDSGWEDWGDSWSEGGLRTEFALDWDDLGIQFGAVIRMYTVSFSGFSSHPNIVDRAPDGNADIQWSPASVLGMWVLGAAGGAGIIVIWYLSRRRRLWT